MFKKEILYIFTSIIFLLDFFKNAYEQHFICPVKWIRTLDRKEFSPSLNPVQ